MDNNNSVKQIDVTAIIKAMIKNRKAYFIGIPVSFILSILIIRESLHVLSHACTTLHVLLLNHILF